MEICGCSPGMSCVILCVCHVAFLYIVRMGASSRQKPLRCTAPASFYLEGLTQGMVKAAAGLKPLSLTHT